ncbi:hypothetical protein [Acidisoma sp. 7E03]
MRRPLALLLVLALPLLPASVGAQAQTTGRVRGSILSVSPSQITVNDRTGQAAHFAIGGATRYTGVKPVALSAIQPGSYIGCAALPATGGKLRALEVTVFPPAMQGVGEGHYPWDLQPESSMTNGTVGSLSRADGNRMTVTYNGGSQTILVPPGVPVVTVEPGRWQDLHPGVKVVILPAPGAPGQAGHILYGEQGITPPQ